MWKKKKVQLSVDNKQILLINIHKLIEEYAHQTANDIQYKRSNKLINYPPNGGLTEAEKEEIDKIGENEILKSALRKIMASNTADVFFSFFNFLDGTADPDFSSALWTGVSLVDSPENQDDAEMLHDDFYSTYWDWRKSRKNTNWKLDLWEE